MPCKLTDNAHRPKVGQPSFKLSACVARPVSKKEIAQNPVLKSGSCQQALDKEWKRFRDQNVSDEPNACQWKAIVRSALEDGRVIHMG